MRNIAIYKATLDNEEIDQLKSVLQAKDDLSKVLEFEEKMVKYIGAKYAIATATSTAALHLALSSMRLKRGDKVLMSVNSFVNLPETVRHFDAEPIFVDINLEDMNLDIEKFEEAIIANKSKKLRAAIITFIGGLAPNLEKIYEIAKKHNILIIEDCRAALGTTYKGQKVGNLSADMTIFSTNPSPSRYAISRSGVLVTNNEELATRAKLLRNHAITTAYDSYGNLDYVYDVDDIGHKFDISELDAAYAIAQLKKTDSFIKRRKEIALKYDEAFLNSFVKPLYSFTNNSSYHLFVVKVDFSKLNISKVELFNKMREKNIGLQLHYIPINKQPYYKSLGYGNEDTPIMNIYYDECFSLPMYSSLSNEEQEYVIKTLFEILK